jgi:hypothetical protein
MRMIWMPLNKWDEGYLYLFKYPESIPKADYRNNRQKLAAPRKLKIRANTYMHENKKLINVN